MSANFEAFSFSHFLLCSEQGKHNLKQDVELCFARVTAGGWQAAGGTAGISLCTCKQLQVGYEHQGRFFARKAGPFTRRDMGKSQRSACFPIVLNERTNAYKSIRGDTKGAAQKRMTSQKYKERKQPSGRKRLCW